MASYRGHLMFASVLGAGYGALGAWRWQLDWGPTFLAAGLTTVGGLLPDLDSDSGVPVRELFGLAAALVPFLAYYRLLHHYHLSAEQTLVIMAAIYILIRYGLSTLFKRCTVHRGMFHSIPGLFVAGLALFLLYHSDDLHVRLYLSAAVMLGFLSHLVLDEIYSVNFMGVRIHLNKYAGSALKLASSSWSATLLTYVLLAGLTYLGLVDWASHGGNRDLFTWQGLDPLHLAVPAPPGK